MHIKIMFLCGYFHPDPLEPGGDLDNSQWQHAVPVGRSVGPRARRAAQGDFQNPRTGDGDLGKIPDQKSEFCTYFFLILGTKSEITCKPLTCTSFSLFPSEERNFIKTFL